VRDGSRFDLASSAVVLVGYAIPGFLFAVLLVVLFAGGSFVQWFPAARPVLLRQRVLAVLPTRAGLRLAHGAADADAGDRRLRGADHADEKLLPGGGRPSSTC
jgi:hypothetical protein